MDGWDLLFFVRDSAVVIHRRGSFDDLPPEVKQGCIRKMIELTPEYQCECIPGADLVNYHNGWTNLVSGFKSHWRAYTDQLAGAARNSGFDPDEIREALGSEALLRFVTDEQLVEQTGYGYYEMLMNNPSGFYAFVAEANFNYLYEKAKELYEEAISSAALGGLLDA